MKIIIFGATGTGKTTLAQELAVHLGWNSLDSDDYYWEQTDPPYEKKIPLAIRNERLKADFLKYQNVIVSGSLFTWGSYWDSVFDLGIFLQLPKKVRMDRLHQREIDRYGDDLLNDPETQKRSQEFLDWAAQYDTPDNDGHSVTKHHNWIQALSCPVIKLTGEQSTEDRIEQIIQQINEIAESKS